MRAQKSEILDYRNTFFFFKDSRVELMCKIVALSRFDMFACYAFALFACNAFALFSNHAIWNYFTSAHLLTDYLCETFDAPGIIS